MLRGSRSGLYRRIPGTNRFRQVDVDAVDGKRFLGHRRPFAVVVTMATWPRVGWYREPGAHPRWKPVPQQSHPAAAAPARPRIQAQPQRRLVVDPESLIARTPRTTIRARLGGDHTAGRCHEVGPRRATPAPGWPPLLPGRGHRVPGAARSAVHRQRRSPRPLWADPGLWIRRRPLPATRRWSDHHPVSTKFSRPAGSTPPGSEVTCGGPSIGVTTRGAAAYVEFALRSRSSEAAVFYPSGGA